MLSAAASEVPSASLHIGDTRHGLHFRTSAIVSKMFLSGAAAASKDKQSAKKMKNSEAFIYFYPTFCIITSQCQNSSGALACIQSFVASELPEYKDANHSLTIKA